MMMFDHPQLGRVNFTAAAMPDNPDAQVDQTIALMRRYALEDSRSPQIAADVRHALGTMDTGRWRTTAGWPLEALFTWVKHKIRFTQDADLGQPLEQAGVLPAGNPVVEVLIRPVDISLGAGHGDCDDFSMYLAAMLCAVGIPCSFATVAADPAIPGQYSHVYVVAYPDGPSGRGSHQRIPMDTSHGPYLGWEVPNQYGKLREWPICGQVPGGADWRV